MVFGHDPSFIETEYRHPVIIIPMFMGFISIKALASVLFRKRRLLFCWMAYIASLLIFPSYDHFTYPQIIEGTLKNFKLWNPIIFGTWSDKFFNFVHVLWREGRRLAWKYPRFQMWGLNGVTNLCFIYAKMVSYAVVDHPKSRIVLTRKSLYRH